MTPNDYILWGFTVLVAAAAFAVGFVAGVQKEKERGHNDVRDL